MVTENLVGSTQEGEESDSDSDVAFASFDFSGVDFDAKDGGLRELTPDETLALEWEKRIAFGDFGFLEQAQGGESLSRVRELAQLLATGQYAQSLRCETSKRFFDGIPNDEKSKSTISLLRQRVLSAADSVIACVELELIGIAALNLFLQGNYTGPAFEEQVFGKQQTSQLAGINEEERVSNHQSFAFEGINPHPSLSRLYELAEQVKRSNLQIEAEEKAVVTRSRRNNQYQNAILAELSVDGEWPVQVCQTPYFLLMARSILLTIANPTRNDWTVSESAVGTKNGSCHDHGNDIPPVFLESADMLVMSRLWSARAAVAHERLLQSREPSSTLWSEVQDMFGKCIDCCCNLQDKEQANPEGATVMLEWGLAEHHFDRPFRGKKSFKKAQELSGLAVEVTGAVGKRTKFQQVATAQMLVRAVSAEPSSKSLAAKVENGAQNDVVKNQLVEHSEEEILLEKIKFDDENDSATEPLNVLDQAIILALCLDVKNSNPADGLTGEEMGAFLARVLHHHDDWMVYSTALLERSWLEFERSHARERAILQMQALADQHTNRLTITQSTRKSVEESAPVQERLKHLHSIVYPPRWLAIQDLADRYAGMGIVTSAAELFTEIECWGDVVDCYTRAGRVSQAERIVRERLAVEETPRMWEALGHLTKDPKHYEKAIEVSHGRYSSAYIALGFYYFDKGELEAAAENYGNALKIRPLVPTAWFRLGTISMQLRRWGDALRAFSEVVQQEPEESDAWANVAAIHMHNKNPSEAYPALVESLKHTRSNWRVWLSKLYTCLDLQKFDEAIQACNILMDLRAQKQVSDGVPPLEEKCVRAIVGGSLDAFQKSKGDAPALDSSQRTLSRVHGLLERLSSSSDAEPWVFETMAVFHEQIGNDEKVLENLLKEYRSLQTVQGWEKDNKLIQKMNQLVSHIVQILRQQKSLESLTKARFIVRGIVKNIEVARPEDATIPEEVKRLQSLLGDIETELKQVQNANR